MLTCCEGLDCLADVRKEHLHLLRTMHDMGMLWAQKLLQEDGSLIFRLGYHSVIDISALEYFVEVFLIYAPLGL